MNLHLVILVAYSLTMVAVAAAVSRRVKRASDFFVAGRQLGPGLIFSTMLAANIAGTLLLKRAVERPSPIMGGAVSLASTAAAVEVFAWTERHADSPVTRALKKPGYELQRVIGTREPTERQLEVGRAALAEILRAEDSN